MCQKLASPRRALARLPETELVRTYVWEKPVRIAHWLIFFAIASLAFTGLYIHRPFLTPAGQAPFLMATMRFIHVVSGFVLIARVRVARLLVLQGQLLGEVVRLTSPSIAQQWRGMGSMLEFYSVHALRSRPSGRA